MPTNLFDAAKKWFAILPKPVREWIRRAHYFRALRNASLHREADLAIAIQLLEPGNTAVDVGANFGLYTRFFSEAVGAGGRVFAIEPIPATFNVLQSNIKRLNLLNVTAIQAASSDCTRTVTMIVPRINGADNFYRAHISAEEAPLGTHRVSVRTAKLDELVPPDVLVALLKVDVEGHELACIRGALEIIKKCEPALLIEVTEDPDFANSAGEVFGLLRSLHYEAYVSNGQRLVRRVRGQRSTNYFFLRSQHRNRLVAKRMSIN
jgi:FkbM family methyltransferase